MNQERANALRYLKTVKGQIDGIIHMLEEERYCIDISNQIMASSALLKKANLHILRGHLESCVKTAMGNKNETDEKLKEIEQVLAKVLK